MAIFIDFPSSEALEESAPWESPGQIQMLIIGPCRAAATQPVVGSLLKFLLTVALSTPLSASDLRDPSLPDTVLGPVHTSPHCNNERVPGFFSITVTGVRPF